MAKCEIYSFRAKSHRVHFFGHFTLNGRGVVAEGRQRAHTRVQWNELKFRKEVVDTTSCSGLANVASQFEFIGSLHGSAFSQNLFYCVFN